MTYALFVDNLVTHDDTYKAAAAEAGIDAVIVRDPVDAVRAMARRGQPPSVIFAVPFFDGYETGGQLMYNMGQIYPSVRRVELGFAEKSPDIYADTYVQKPF